MSSFVDVQPYDWFYKDVEDAYWLFLRDGQRFLKGIPYNIFEDGGDPLDEVYTESTGGSSELLVSQYINATSSNPILVYIDGIQVALDNVNPSEADDNTYIKLKRAVPKGAEVRIFFAGVPAFNNDSLHSPVGVTYDVGHEPEFPSVALQTNDGSEYMYDPLNPTIAEVVLFKGIQLHKVYSIDEIKDDYDYYVDVDNYGARLYVNYVLNNQGLEISFLGISSSGVKKSFYNKLNPTSDNIIYHNRFFPSTGMTRAEIITLLNRFRVHLYLKYTDTEAPRESWRTESRFEDVQTALEGVTPWYWEDLRDMEAMQDSGGNFLLKGESIGNGEYRLYPSRGLKRAELSTLLNTFRKIMIDAFK